MTKTIAECKKCGKKHFSRKQRDDCRYVHKKKSMEQINPRIQNSNQQDDMKSKMSKSTKDSLKGSSKLQPLDIEFPMMQMVHEKIHNFSEICDVAVGLEPKLIQVNEILSDVKQRLGMIDSYWGQIQNYIPCLLKAQDLFKQLQGYWKQKYDKWAQLEENFVDFLVADDNELIIEMDKFQEIIDGMNYTDAIQILSSNLQRINQNSFTQFQPSTVVRLIMRTRSIEEQIKSIHFRLLQNPAFTNQPIEAINFLKQMRMTLYVFKHNHQILFDLERQIQRKLQTLIQQKRNMLNKMKPISKGNQIPSLILQGKRQRSLKIKNIGSLIGDQQSSCQSEVNFKEKKKITQVSSLTQKKFVIKHQTKVSQHLHMIFTLNPLLRVLYSDEIMKQVRLGIYGSKKRKAQIKIKQQDTETCVLQSKPMVKKRRNVCLKQVPYKISMTQEGENVAIKYGLLEQYTRTCSYKSNRINTLEYIDLLTSRKYGLQKPLNYFKTKSEDILDKVTHQKEFIEKERYYNMMEGLIKLSYFSQVHKINFKRTFIVIVSKQIERLKKRKRIVSIGMKKLRSFVYSRMKPCLNKIQFQFTFLQKIEKGFRSSISRTILQFWARVKYQTRTNKLKGVKIPIIKGLGQTSNGPQFMNFCPVKPKNYYVSKITGLKKILRIVKDKKTQTKQRMLHKNRKIMFGYNVKLVTKTINVEKVLVKDLKSYLIKDLGIKQHFIKYDRQSVQDLYRRNLTNFKDYRKLFDQNFQQQKEKFTKRQLSGQKELLWKRLLFYFGKFELNLKQQQSYKRKFDVNPIATLIGLRKLTGSEGYYKMIKSRYSDYYTQGRKCLIENKKKMMYYNQQVWKMQVQKSQLVQQNAQILYSRYFHSRTNNTAIQKSLSCHSIQDSRKQKIDLLSSIISCSQLAKYKSQQMMDSMNPGPQDILLQQPSNRQIKILEQLQNKMILEKFLKQTEFHKQPNYSLQHEQSDEIELQISGQNKPNLKLVSSPELIKQFMDSLEDDQKYAQVIKNQKLQHMNKILKSKGFNSLDQLKQIIKQKQEFYSQRRKRLFETSMNIFSNNVLNSKDYMQKKAKDLQKVKSKVREIRQNQRIQQQQAKLLIIENKNLEKIEIDALEGKIGKDQYERRQADTSENIKFLKKSGFVRQVQITKKQIKQVDEYIEHQLKLGDNLHNEFCLKKIENLIYHQQDDTVQDYYCMINSSIFWEKIQNFKHEREIFNSKKQNEIKQKMKKSQNTKQNKPQSVQPLQKQIHFQEIDSIPQKIRQTYKLNCNGKPFFKDPGLASERQVLYMNRQIETFLLNRKVNRYTFHLRKNVCRQGTCTKFNPEVDQRKFLRLGHSDNELLDLYQSKKRVFPIKYIFLGEQFGGGFEASRNIKKQQLVGFFNGNVMTAALGQKLKNQHNMMTYIERQTQQQTLVITTCDNVWSIGPMFNHAPDSIPKGKPKTSLSNLRVVGFMTNRGVQYLMFATKNIQKGQHLTWDYRSGSSKTYVMKDLMGKQIQPVDLNALGNKIKASQNKDVLDLWRRAKHYPHESLFTMDLRSFQRFKQQQLNSISINQYCRFLNRTYQHANIFVTNTYFTVVTLFSDQKLFKYISKFKLAQKSDIFIPTFINQNHWILLHLSTNQQLIDGGTVKKVTCTINDSMSFFNTMQYYQQRLRKVFDQLTKMSEKYLGASTQILLNEKFPNQDGVVDCGVFMLAGIKSIINNSTFDKSEIPEMRIQMANQLYNFLRNQNAISL